MYESAPANQYLANEVAFLENQTQVIPMFGKNTDIKLSLNLHTHHQLHCTQWNGKEHTTVKDIEVSKYIHPCTLEAAYEVASNLREDDLRECVEGHGIVPTIHIPLASLEGSCSVFHVPSGETAGIVGIQGDKIWMLCTPAIHQYPLTFAREAKRFIDSRMNHTCGTLLTNETQYILSSSNS